MLNNCCCCCCCKKKKLSSKFPLFGFVFSPFGALLKLTGTCSHLEIYRRVERQSPRRFVNSADLNSTSAHSRGRFSPGPPPVPRRKVTHRGGQGGSNWKRNGSRATTHGPRFDYLRRRKRSYGRIRYYFNWNPFDWRCDG